MIDSTYKIKPFETRSSQLAIVLFNESLECYGRIPRKIHKTIPFKAIKPDFSVIVHCYIPSEISRNSPVLRHA